MPPRQKGGLPSKAVVVPADVAEKTSKLEELKRDCDRIRQEIRDLQELVDQHEASALETVQHYRGEIDDRTTKMNEVRRQITDLHAERDELIGKLKEDNEKAKEKVAEEDAAICSEIDSLKSQLEIIRVFEQEKDSISREIEMKEQSIEDEKKKFEEQIETAKKTTQDLLDRNAKQNEEYLEKEKEEYYDFLLTNTDQAVLMHIQRRNNYENDLLSLKDMANDYTEKIKTRKEANQKLKDAISQLKKDDLIDRSAEQRKSMSTLRRDIDTAKEQLKQLQAKTKKDQETDEQYRKDEIEKVDLALKLQQDQLDHKLQQIAALRELTLTVLSYRSQLEAEFITVLGEVIYEACQRENPKETLESQATRRLSMSSVSSKVSQENTGRIRELSIGHVLARFTPDDRYTVLQRFLDRIQGDVEQNDPMTPLPEQEPCHKPTSV